MKILEENWKIVNVLNFLASKDKIKKGFAISKKLLNFSKEM